MYLLVLIAVTPSAFADLSVVADLDSIAHNGPDSLLIEPTDTVLVRIWLTGSDSLHSFGITFGDGSGTLSWVEETASIVYNIPNGWTGVEVQEENGWLLIQATDFSMGNPIHANHEVARLKFVVTPGDSCGILEGDLENSGWFHIDTGEGSFTGFEGQAICVSHVLDGGGEGGAPGEGGGEDGDDGSDEGGGDGENTVTLGRYDCRNDLIEVMFHWDSKVRIRSDELVDLRTDALQGLEGVLGSLVGHEWSRATIVPEQTLDDLQARGERNAGRPVYNLNNIYRLRIPETEDIWSIAEALEALPGVHSARPWPLPALLPNPPNYEQTHQLYLDPALPTPTGIDAEYAWTLPGGDGSGVTVCDIERDWNYDHADLSQAPGSQIRPDAYRWIQDRSHGTAVIGELVSDPNGWGTTGICYGSTLLTCATFVGIFPDPPVEDVVGAIVEATAHLSAGDVLLIEYQWDYQDPNTPLSDFIPLEWWTTVYPDTQYYNAVYAAIETAVLIGINVIEPGGNGGGVSDSGYDMNTLQWLGDSGAIVVGAGGVYSGGSQPEGDLERITYSSFGSRVNLQGWGENVTTTGWGGTLYDEEGINYNYSDIFGGTSAASPIVAGAVACLVGYWIENVSSIPPTPGCVREILIRTGTPQVMPPDGNIGPRPDLRAAIEAADIATSIGVSEWRESSSISLSVAPNPINSNTHVFFSIPDDANVELILYNLTGQRVATVQNGRLSSGSYILPLLGNGKHERSIPSGIYFLRLSADGRHSAQRVLVFR